MKRLIATFFGVAAMAAGAFAQSNTTVRPRVATTPTPPVIQNDSRSSERQSGVPTLIGGNRPKPAPTATPLSDDENEVIKVETELVTMPVSVLDKDGRFISGLTQRDFQIFENGVQQQVEYFQSVEQPFTVIMLIDVSPSTEFRIEEIQNAAIAFVDQLRPKDRVMVVAFDENVTVLSPVTNNRFQLKDAIRSVQFGNGTSLYEAVDEVIEQQLKFIQGRKAVVLFTDGVDTTSRRATYQSTVAATEEVDALFYTVRYDTSDRFAGQSRPQQQPRGGNRRGNNRVTLGDILGAILTGGNVQMGGGGGAGASKSEYETGRQYLETISTNSGGRHFEANNITNVTAAFAGIAEELRRQYSLGYYPTKVGTVGERKQIKVRVMRPQVVVRAKTFYVVGKTGPDKFAGR
jgi:VWFA-related protein